MAIAQKEYTMEELEERYNEISALYDMSEELLATVESPLVADQEAQLALVEPLIHEIGEATDMLAEEFTVIAEQKKQRAAGRRANKSQVEGALRRVYGAISEYNAKMRAAGKKMFNVAEAIVQKIQRQVDKVVVIFLEFMQISLSSLMNKAELEALKAREVRIALMMHQQAIAQHQGGNF